jgi:hypothetical protein
MAKDKSVAKIVLETISCGKTPEVNVLPHKGTTTMKDPKMDIGIKKFIGRRLK